MSVWISFSISFAIFHFTLYCCSAWTATVAAASAAALPFYGYVALCGEYTNAVYLSYIFQLTHTADLVPLTLLPHSSGSCNSSSTYSTSLTTFCANWSIYLLGSGTMRVWRVYIRYVHTYKRIYIRVNDCYCILSWFKYCPAEYI